MIEIQIRKFHNQFKNGINLDQNLTEFTHFLLGFVGQRMRRVTQIAVSWNFPSSVANTVTIVSGENQITRQTGSWHDDGFQINDGIAFESPLEALFENNIVTNVTDLVMTVQNNWTIDADSFQATVFGSTKLLGMNYFSNLIENDDPAGYISKVDLISTKKWAGEFTLAQYDAGTVITATPSGLVESWKMDSDVVTIEVIQSPIQANGYIQKFEIVETFTITPFFDNISNLEAGIKPDYLIDSASLKHIARFEALHTILNPIIKHILDDSENPDTNGNVGYYDEHANGFTPVEFSKDTIAYSNASSEDKIVIDEVTTITCKIDSLNNVLSQGNSQFQMNLILLNEAIESGDNIDTNFAFDTVFAVTNAAPKSGENGIFSNVEGNIVANQLANQLVVTADITFTPTQQSLIEDGKYIIAIATNDHTLAIDASKLVNVNMDINDFVKNNDIPDLMAIDTNKFYEHPFDKGTQGKTDFQGWVEDGILMSADFTLDLSKNAVINNMNVRLMAFNSVTDEDFEITCIPLDFTAFVTSGGVQQIDIDSTRGFKLVDGAQFNFLKVQLMAKVGDLQHYDLDIGFKLQWMDWIALAEADPVFFDSGDINNGLNRLISNYSNLNDFDIVMFIDAEVNNGEVNTNYRFVSPALRTFEYETDDTGDPSTKWVGLVETFDQSANNLNANLHGTQNTDVKITFTAQSGLISEAVLYAIVRLEEFQQGGLFNIFELSTFRNALITDNPLIPLPGENKAIFTTFASSVEVECAIDFTKLNPGSQYKISARLGTACDESSGCAWESKNSGVSVLLSGVDFVSVSVGIAVGVGGTIIKTTDSAETWISKNSGVGLVLRDVIFFDANLVYTCGNNGTVLKSTDGGDTWVDKSPITAFVLTDLHFDDTTTGWVCGSSGKIFKTTNGGDAWVEQTSGVFNSLTSIFFIDANTGWAVSITGQIIKTTDGGANWSAQVSGTSAALEEIFFITDLIGWIAGHQDTTLLTTDGGANWVIVQTPLLGNVAMRSISFIDVDNGIITGDGGTIFRSTDGGNTWIQESSGTIQALLDCEILGLTDAYAVGANGEIVKYVCTTGSCDILQDGKLKEDGTPKLKEDGDNKILE